MQSGTNPSLPANWEMQGDFAKMQGETEPSPANSLKISVICMQSPYSRSREAIIFSREIRDSRLDVAGSGMPEVKRAISTQSEGW
jgi:hypothetical protein